MSEEPPLKIQLDTITQVERRPPNFGSRCSTIYFRTHQSETFGPFEFVQGGTRDFLEMLKNYIDLQQNPSYPTRYKVLRKIPVYQLPAAAASNSPMNVIQGMGTKLVSLVDSLVLGVADLGGSTSHAGGNLLDPATTLFRPNERGYNSHSPDDGFIDPEAAARRVMMNNIYADRHHLLDPVVSSEDGFQIVSHQRNTLLIDLPPPILVPRMHPLTSDEWRRHIDRDGRVTMVNKLQADIYNGGVDPEIRPVVWKYLFGYLKWDFTATENASLVEEKHHHYRVMKTFWKSMSLPQMKNFRVFRERKSIIKKDTVRTDRQTPFFRDDSTGHLTKLYNILMTYTFYNIDLGYFQGMNDLLAIIMTEVDGEEDAFWCFVGVMDRLAGHFSDGPSSLSNQFALLFRLIEILLPDFAQFLRNKEATSMNFCFRWFLIAFKREFSYDDVKVLWESLWSGCAPPNYQLLIAVAIFTMEADYMRTSCHDISQILQHVNNLTEHIDLRTVLSRAQGIHNQLALIQDHLPRELAAALGFSSAESAPGVLFPTSSSADNLNDLENDDFMALDQTGLFVPVPPKADVSNDDKHEDEKDFSEAFELGCELNTAANNSWQ